MRCPRAGAMLAAACLFVLASCGGSAPVRKTAPPSPPFVAKSYHFDPVKGVTLTIAPPPISGELGKRIDTALATAFSETPGCQIMGRAEAIRYRMTAEHGLVLTLDKIQAEQYDDSTLARSPSLTRFMSDTELSKFRTQMYSANLLLVPGEFTLQSTASAASGRVRFRVYDLTTGDLVMQHTVEKQLPTGGPAGEREVTTELILLIQDEFAKYLLRA